MCELGKMKSEAFKIKIWSVILLTIPLSGFLYYKLPGIGLRLYEIATFGATAIILLNGLTKGDLKIRRTRWTYAKPLLVFIIAVTILNIISYVLSLRLNPDLSFYSRADITQKLGIVSGLRIVRIFLYALFALFISYFCRKPSHIINITKVIVVTGSLNALWGIIQFLSYLVKIPIPLPMSNAAPWPGVWWTGASARILGFCIEPLGFGNFLAVPFCASLCLFLNRKTIFHFVPLLIISGAIVLTFSTSAWLICLLAILIYSIFLADPRIRRRLLLVIGIFTCILAFMVFPILRATGLLIGNEVSWDKLMLRTGSGIERMNAINTTWNMIKGHPLFGVGPGNIPFFHNQYNQLKVFDINYLKWYPNNEFMQIGAESGTIVLGLWVALFWQLIKSSRDLSKTDDSRLRPYIQFLFLAICGQAAHLNFGFFTQSTHFWLIIGMIFGVGNILQIRQKDEISTAVMNRVLPSLNSKVS